MTFDQYLAETLRDLFNSPFPLSPRDKAISIILEACDFIDDTALASAVRQATKTPE